MPQLSAGFRQRVLAEVSTSAAKAVRTRRIKQATSTLGAVCAVILLFMFWPESQPQSGQMSVEQVPQVKKTTSPLSESQSPGQGDTIPPLKSSSSGIAVDTPVPRKSSGPDMMEQLIEDLGNRSQLFQ